MTPYRLIAGLKRGLEGEVRLKLPAQNQAEKPVRTYLQSIPDVEFSDDTFYPLILIELVGVRDEFELSTAQVLITIGTYNDDDGRGWQDNLNLGQRVRAYVLTHPLLESYSLQLPMEYVTVEKTLDNFSFSQILITYAIPIMEVRYNETRDIF